MTYIADLDDYDYTATEETLLAVGWLESSHEFTRGTVEPPVVERLKTLAAHQAANRTRGLHRCGLVRHGRHIHIIRGLDTRDLALLALLATACTDRANHLAHLLTGLNNNRGTDPANRLHDLRQATADADRLRYNAHSLLQHR